MTKIDCCIFDLDGTLADVRHRLHYVKGVNGPDWKPNWPAFFDACVHDLPHEYVIRLNRILYNTMPVFICSGRPDTHQVQTEQWLAANGVRYTQLLMRGAKDYRKDTIVKLEMLGHLRGLGFNPVFSIDDRPEVVHMWRGNGVPCFVVDQAEWL